MGMVMRVLGVVVAVLAVVPARGAGLPSCAGPVEAHDVVVVRVERNGDLVLADGRAVRLEGLLLPAGRRDHAPAYLAEEALSVLGGLASGRSVTLSVFVPKEDRYGRIRAQVSTGAEWLQDTMLRRGLARVSIAPERRECASELYAAEDAARTAHAGIWKTGFYDVRAPEALAGTVGTFQIVEGNVISARIRNGRAYLDFGSDWRRDFKVMIAPDDLRRFRDAGVDPRTYEGLRLRVRGFVDGLGGPEIEAASPAAIEVIQ
jgi:hypothetical protein